MRKDTGSPQLSSAPRGLSASRSTILGSVSSRVIQDARHPVLVVRSGPISEPVWGPVFVCYDGSDAAGYPIAW